MVLKEAYRYQNFLNSLIATAEGYLLKRDFVTKTKQTHNRKKVNPDAQDETIEVRNSYNVDFTPMQLVDFISKALGERQKLSDAIVEAKRSAEIDIDSSIAMNKDKQGYLKILSSMAKLKSDESVSRGTGYKFNADGDQVSYYYEIDNVTTIDYDRNDIRSLIKKLQKETDDVSVKLDVIQSTTEVNYDPIWDLSDTLEDVVLQ